MSRTVRSPLQPSLFGPGDPRQGDLLDPGAGPVAPPATPVSKGPPSTREEIHAAMLDTLAMLRAATTPPWTDWEIRYQVGLFRLRARWFPPEIADPMLADFDREADRLDVNHDVDVSHV